MATGLGAEENTVRRSVQEMIARVLIVDDHALVATVLRFALRERGWSVETAAGVTADEVVEHARGFRPRCVLLDTRLGPTTIGIELIAPLRASGAEVVMLTAETEPAVLAAFLEAGAAGWISKHDALDDVEAALNKVHAGVALIGPGRREAMLAELRSQRVSRRLTLSPFERMTTWNATCSPRSSKVCPPRRSPSPATLLSPPCAPTSAGCSTSSASAPNSPL